MTKPRDALETRAHIVIVFDIVSSTTILEELLRSESQKRWRDLIIGLKKELLRICSGAPMTPYKFTGDGWILLADVGIKPKDLLNALVTIRSRYLELFNSIVKPVLATAISRIGVSFGMDRGTLVHIRMNNQDEYVGRPLNVAARLQSALKSEYWTDAKVLMTNSLYADLKEYVGSKYLVQEKIKVLRNITGGSRFRCQLVYLDKKPVKRKGA